MLKRVMYSGAVYFGAASAMYLYVRSTKCPRGVCDHHVAPASPSRGSIFDGIAADYDARIGLDEALMGIGLLRWWLLRRARGAVLEVSAGTGRNLRYYPPHAVHSLTLTDASRQMLSRAFDKYRESSGALGDVPLTFCLADVEALCPHVAAGAPAPAAASGGTGRGAAGFGPALDAPRTFRPASFDTVVDTFGLCSCEDPVRALEQMARALRPGGSLLLLEHGRSSWAFVNRILDSGAGQHCAKWGCQWNRDIEALVRQAGLVVESSSRWHFGTTYVVVARPRVAAQREGV